MTMITHEKEGEIRHKNFERKNHLFITMAVIYACFFTAFASYVMVKNNVHLLNFSGITIPVWQSVILAIGTFIAMFILPLLSMKTVDELEMQINVKACVIGILSTAAIYPAWRALSLSNLLPVPTGDQTFLMIIGSAFLSYLFIKIRN